MQEGEREGWTDQNTVLMHEILKKMQIETSLDFMLSQLEC